MGAIREEVTGEHIRLKRLLGTSDMQGRWYARPWVNVEMKKRDDHSRNLLKKQRRN